MTREEAIAQLNNVRDSISEEAIDMAIEALEQEPCEDCISRKEIIRWVKTECNPYGKPTLDFESGKKVIEHLEQMPSAEPKTGEESRTMTKQEAIKILNKYDLNFCDINGNPIPPQDLAEACDMAIEALQREPKRGYWLEAREEDPCWYICSECGRMVDDDSDYCPNCGARMESDEE